VVHRGIILCFAGKSYRIDLPDLTSGKATTLDACEEMLEHLLAPRLAWGGHLILGAATTGNGRPRHSGLRIPVPRCEQ
jgi:hypothetical protein